MTVDTSRISRNWLLTVHRYNLGTDTMISAGFDLNSGSHCFEIQNHLKQAHRIPRGQSCAALKSLKGLIC